MRRLLGSAFWRLVFLVAGLYVGLWLTIDRVRRCERQIDYVEHRVAMTSATPAPCQPGPSFATRLERHTEHNTYPDGKVAHRG